MKDKSLIPGIYISIGMIAATFFAYVPDVPIFWVALMSTVYGLLKIVDNYEKLSN